MVRQEPLEYRERERPSLSLGSEHPNIGPKLSVLVLDSIVDDVARIVDTRDNVRQQFF